MDNYIRGGDEIIEVVSYGDLRKRLRYISDYELHSREGSRDGARSGHYVVCDCAAPRNRNIVFTAPDQETADKIYNRILSGK